MKYKYKLRNILLIILIFIINGLLFYNSNAKNIETNKEINDLWITGLPEFSLARSTQDVAFYDNKLYIFGGINGLLSTTNKVEIYDLETHTWSYGKDMPLSKSKSSTVTVGDKIYVISGMYETATSYRMDSTLHIYDPNQDTWENGGSIPHPREGATANIINGKIYLIGGNSNIGMVDEVDIYDIETKTWSEGTSIPKSRFFHSSVVVDNNIYILGGTNSDSEIFNDILSYNVETNTWDNVTTMPVPLSNQTTFLYNDNIYVISGEDESTISQKVYIYNLNNNEWSLGTNLPYNNTSFGSAFINDRLYVIGGTNWGKYFDTLNLYFPNVTEELAEQEVEKAKSTRSQIDIKIARALVNDLPESIKKESLEIELNEISPDLNMELKTTSANLDVYIKSENMLSLSLNTNSITFDEYSGIDDIELKDAVQLKINSSLPYDINAYLETEFQNKDKTQILDKSLFRIKDSNEDEYKEFLNIKTPVLLFSNEEAGNNKTHSIDLILNNSKTTTHVADVYKSTVKFEVKQK